MTITRNNTVTPSLHETVTVWPKVPDLNIGVLQCIACDHNPPHRSFNPDFLHDSLTEQFILTRIGIHAQRQCGRHEAISYRAPERCVGLRSCHRRMDRTAKHEYVLTGECCSVIIIFNDLTLRRPSNCGQGYQKAAQSSKLLRRYFVRWKVWTSYPRTAGSQPNLERHPPIVGIPFIDANLTECKPTYLAYRSALPGAILAFHLKQCHTLLPDSFVGSVEITVDELRTLCERDERMSCCSTLFRNAANVTSFQTAVATLELQDKRNKLVARLIVQLRESDALQAVRVAVSAARRDITERGIANPSPIHDSVDNAVGLVASANAMTSPLVNSLKQMVDKTKFIVDVVDKTAKVSLVLAR